jgi:hypothetical protein
MRRLIIGLVLLVGCDEAVKATYYTTPEGKMGVITICQHAPDCWVEVSKKCPGGYNIIRNDDQYAYGNPDERGHHLTVDNCKTTLTLQPQTIEGNPAEGDK